MSAGPREVRPTLSEQRRRFRELDHDRINLLVAKAISRADGAQGVSSPPWQRTVRLNWFNRVRVVEGQLRRFIRSGSRSPVVRDAAKAVLAGYQIDPGDALGAMNALQF